MRSRPLRPSLLLSLLPPRCSRHPHPPLLAVKTDWSGGHWEPSQQTGPEERSEANSSPRRRNYKEGGRERENKQMASAVKSGFQTFKILLVLIISEPYWSQAVGEGRNENQGLRASDWSLPAWASHFPASWPVGHQRPRIPGLPAPAPPGALPDLPPLYLTSQTPLKALTFQFSTRLQVPQGPGLCFVKNKTKITNYKPQPLS